MAIVVTIFTIGAIVWIACEILFGTLKGVALSFSITTICFLLFEWFTYWYLSKNGILKNNKI